MTWLMALVKPLGRDLWEMAMILLLLACLQGTASESGTEPEVRLVNGPNRCAGRVEVFHDGQWGSICDDNWDMREARVVCRQLGCGAASSVPADAHFGRGAGPIWLDNVKCKGTESALSQCLANPWGKSNCDHQEDASVVCSGVASDSDPAAEIRLQNGPHRCSGRVEVFYRRFWGTICDNGWGIEEAGVVCRQLGCGEAKSAETDAQFGKGDKPIWLDDLRCKGTESALSQCPASDWGENNCTHRQDAGVVCSGGIWGSDPSSTNPEIRLVNGPRRCTGRVELSHDGQWGTICDDGWDIKEAKVVCRQLGCGKAKFSPDKALYGSGSGPIWLSDLNCNGTESALSQCPARDWGVNNCRHNEDASVVCSGVDFISDTAVEVRLANGSSNCSGRVEVFHNDQWGTVCDDGWSIAEATVICQQLGCGGARSAPVGAQFGRGDGPIWLNDVQCIGIESALNQCQAKPWEINNCNHAEDAGVVCSGGSLKQMSAQILPPLMRSLGKEWRAMVTILTFLAWPSDSTKLRLVNGSHQCSGRVEVLFLLEYGTVCDDGWDLKEATVVCRNLDCGTAVFAARRAQFGQGSGLIWQDDVECTGNESSLSECQSKPVGSHNCHPEQDAGVVCSDSVRLVGGSNRCSGRVEVRALPSNKWRTICYHTLDIKDAEVVCRQLGCGKVISVQGGMHFGMGSSSILEEVHCNGTEDDIAQCIVQTEGNNGCHKEAGVVCSEPSTINIADVRLTGGSNSCAGKVEVFYQNQWGTVCRKGWDLLDAHVVCKQLGCGTALKVPQETDFRDRPGLIWLSNVTCMGHEKSLQFCKGILTGEHECGHSEEANVVCTSAGYSQSNTFLWSLIITLLFAIAFLVHEDAISLQNYRKKHNFLMRSFSSLQ